MYKRLAFLLVLVLLSSGCLAEATKNKSVRYEYPENGNSITFYPSDNTFFIDQKDDLTGTYIETPEAYGLTFNSGFGTTVKKTDNGIEVKNGHDIQIWNKV